MCVSVCLGDIVQSPSLSLSLLSKEIGTILCEAYAQLILMPPPHLSPTRSRVLCTSNYTHTHATQNNKENGGGGKKKEISIREDET